MKDIKKGDFIIAKIHSIPNITKSNKYTIRGITKEIYFVTDDSGKSHGFLIKEFDHYFYKDAIKTEPQQIEVGSKWVHVTKNYTVKVSDVKNGIVEYYTRGGMPYDREIDTFLKIYKPKPTKKEKLVKFLEWLDNPTLKGYSKEGLAYLYIEHLKQK